MFKITKKRAIVILFSLIIVLIAVCGVFIVSYEGQRACSQCGTTEDYSETCFFVIGAEWESVKRGKQFLSPFLVDFPEHHCEHSWKRSALLERPIWGSWIWRLDQHETTDTNGSAIVIRYSTDPSFRQGIQKILADGTLTKQHLLELAKLRCMDGGTCQMDRNNPGDAAVLNLIYENPR